MFVYGFSGGGRPLASSAWSRVSGVPYHLLQWSSEAPPSGEPVDSASGLDTVPDSESSPNLTFATDATVCGRPPRIHLVTSTFDNPNPQRTSESLFALMQNLGNPSIDFVHVLAQKAEPGRRVKGSVPPAHARLASGTSYLTSRIPTQLGSKLRVRPVDRQPTYPELFDYVGSTAEYCQGDIAVIAHSDIFITPSTAPLLHALAPAPGAGLFALSRQARLADRPESECETLEGDNGSCLNQCLAYDGSHDVFAFRPPLRPAADAALHRWADIKPNTWQGENHLISVLTAADLIAYKVEAGLPKLQDSLTKVPFVDHDLVEADVPLHDGVTVVNPCKSIHAVHVHWAGSRGASAVLDEAAMPPIRMVEYGLSEAGALAEVCEDHPLACDDRFM